jgi:hypothetical protein
MAHPRAHQPIQLAALLQQVEPAQGGNDLLADFLSLPNAVRNLEVTLGAGGFDAEKHKESDWVYRQQPQPPQCSQQKRQNGPKKLHYIFEFLTLKSRAKPLWERVS